MKFAHYLVILFISLFGFFRNLNAQITIQFTSVNEYMFSSKEALNFIAVNSGKQNVSSVFKGTITGQNSTLVAEFSTEPTLLQLGANVISPNSIAIKDIQYHNSDIAEIEQKTGTYPSGDYRICIWAVCALPDCGGIGAGAGATEQAECLQVHIENPTPLLLAYPENLSEIDQTRPLYSWIPPGPVASSASLNYSMTLVEMQQGQSRSDALALNRPIIQENGLTQQMLNHPLDLPALEEGKTYAWQVQAFVGQTFFAKSEQWQFKVKKDTLPKVGKQILTFKSVANINPCYVKRQDSLLLVFEQNYQFDKKSDWDIQLQEEFTSNKVNLDFNILTSYYNGLNGILVSPLQHSILFSNQVYKLQLKSIKGELFFIRLIFKD